MAATLTSDNIDKVKVANRREEARLRLRMDDMTKQRRKLLDQLQKETMTMVNEVKANKMRELRMSLRKGLGVDDQVNLMKRRVFAGGGANHDRRRMPNTNKGFSKISFDEDEEDDTEVYMEFLRQKTTPELHVLQAMWAKRRQEEEQKGQQHTDLDIRDTDVFVRYPTSANAKTRGVISVQDVHEMQKLKMQRLQHQKPLSHRWRPQSEPIGTKRSQYPIPKYVGLMQRQWNTTYDMYTDGTMLLEVRRAKQRQRERTPVPSGFLPVRRRYTAAGCDDLDNQVMLPKGLKERIASSGPAMAIHGKPPNNQRVYLPKAVVDDGTEDLSEEQEEVQRLMRLKLADQVEQYESTLRSTSGFLGGKDPLEHNSLPKEQLSTEELIMLDQLRQVPEFRGTPRPAWSVASRSIPPSSRVIIRSSPQADQIKDIMIYVLSKDYSTNVDNSKTGKPPPKLDRSDDSN